MLKENSRVFIIPIVIILLYLLPLIILGENSYITIFDNLDCHIAFYKVLAGSNQIFGSLHSVVLEVMNGVPRASFISEFNILFWIFYFFKTFNAIVISEFIMHFVAFFGMYLLLKKHFLKDSNNNIAIIGASLTFALLPFFTSRGLGIAGQPLVLYAFLNLREKKSSIYDWLIFTIIPFYSILEYSAVFLLFGLVCIAIYDLVKTRQLNYMLWASIILMSLLHIINEYRLIYAAFLDHSFTTHRGEFSLSISPNPPRLAFKNFLSGAGQPWTKSFHSPFIIASCLIAFFAAFKKKIRIDLLIALTIICVSISVIFYGLLVSPLARGLQENIEFVRTFSFQRFCSLLPLIWYAMFGISMAIIVENFKHGKNLVRFLILAQIVFLFLSSFTIKNLARDIFHIKHSSITYRQYYAESLFREIRDYIGEDQKNYRVVNIGLEPSITMYNGFYTLDAYLNNYSLEYKNKFRKIIEKELAKDKQLGGFDIWGNRCYLFSRELEKYSWRSHDRFRVRDLKLKKIQINTEAIKDLDGKYIFSTLEIQNCKENHLKFLKLFKDNQTTYKIYLYKVE